MADIELTKITPKNTALPAGANTLQRFTISRSELETVMGVTLRMRTVAGKVVKEGTDGAALGGSAYLTLGADTLYWLDVQDMNTGPNIKYFLVASSTSSAVIEIEACQARPGDE